MRIQSILLLAGLGLPLFGCASYQGEGGTSDEYNTTMDRGESYPQPAGSPTFRPGMNPQDPRDPHFTNRPQPQQIPPP